MFTTQLDWRIELIPLAVSDVDRSVGSYGGQLGWSVDHDRTVSEGLRFVRFDDPDGNRWALQQIPRRG